MHYQLAETLMGLIAAVDVTPSSGLVITRAEIDFPLEVFSARRGNTAVFYASPPHSRWKSGVLPDVHMAKLRVEIEEA